MWEEYHKEAKRMRHGSDQRMINQTKNHKHELGLDVENRGIAELERTMEHMA